MTLAVERDVKQQINLNLNEKLLAGERGVKTKLWCLISQQIGTASTEVF